MNSRQEYFLSLPITQAARQTAEQFAQQQPTVEKAEQVRLNTLAVLVVNDYLQLMGIPTKLKAGDSWNPITRLCADVADLEIIGVGRLECRPLLAVAPKCRIPPEVSSERIGYVVVQIGELLQESTLLGFTPTATEEIRLAQLHSPEALLAHLHQLKQSVAAPQPLAAVSTVVNLSRWLSGVFDPGWQGVEALLSPTQPSLTVSFRSAELCNPTELEPSEARIRQVKLLDWGKQRSEDSVALLVELLPQLNQPISIGIQVHPMSDRGYLPPNLQLIVLDESGTVFLSAQSRSTDNYLQLQLSGEPGERFSVKVTWDDASLTQDFVI